MVLLKMCLAYKSYNISWRDTKINTVISGPLDAGIFHFEASGEACASYPWMRLITSLFFFRVRQESNKSENVVLVQ